ncbi:hypothetical protein [Endomicrobium proavitum]|uniref:Uncharacterized protein n=1 Tax=Endomicrobium proavitum TaxID=1408281 RepID=A0A0G3WKW9_9BACT|nr:hypothetical protein [Endomicrobium proavitum]AKL98497.1 membrane protein of unknown function [Endomicrobium proavitum]
MNNFSIKQAFRFALKFFTQNFYKVFFFTTACVFAERALVFSNLIFANSVLGQNSSFTAKLFAQMFVICTPILFESLIFFFLTSFAAVVFKQDVSAVKNFFPSAQKIALFIYGLIILSLPMFTAVLCFFALTSDGVQKFFTDANLLSISILVPFIVLGAGVAISALIARFSFFYFGVLEGLSLADSFAKSARITLMCRKKIFLFLVLSGVINFAGFILVAGSILTIPLISLAMVYIYFELNKNPDEVLQETQKELI